MPEDYQQISDSIFRAIESGNLEIVKEILEKDPLVLERKNSNGLTPIFLAIKSKNLMKMPEVQKKIVEAIIEEDSLVLTQEDSIRMTPIFRAIASGNLEIVKMLIKKYPKVLEQEESFGMMTPIFFAIRSQSLMKMPEVQKQIIKAIIEEDLLVLKQKDPSGMTPIFWAASFSVRSLGHDNEDGASEVLQTILDCQCPRDINKGGQEDFKKLFLTKMLLKGIYSGKRVGFTFELLEKAFNKITLGNTSESTSENTFKKIYQDLFKNVDKNQPIDSTKNEEMFIFQSNLEGHTSFFIFHVNKGDGKLTSISYCDSNEIDVERKIKDSTSHINGVTTFKLKTPIGYDNNFAKNFIEENSQDKHHIWFYNKFRNKDIIFQGRRIDFSEITHSIPTKAQKRGNCSFKVPSLSVRFILETIDPTMKFGFDEVSQKPTGAGYDEYKKFKDGLTKNALDFIMKIKEKISSKSDSFSDYLREEIEDIMKIVETHSTTKLSKDGQPREEFHQEMNNLLSKDGQPRKEFHQEMNHLLFRNKEEAPKPSCFPFFASCFSSNKTPKPSLSCFPFFASRLSNKTPQQQATPFIPF
jgi:hypothetical protein